MSASLRWWRVASAAASCLDCQVYPWNVGIISIIEHQNQHQWAPSSFRWRAQWTKSRGPKDLQLEVGVRRSPWLLVFNSERLYTQWLDSCIKVVSYSCLPGRESREGEKSTQLAGGHNIISGSNKLVRTRILFILKKMIILRTAMSTWMATMAARAIERSRIVRKVKGKEARAERTKDVRLSLYLINHTLLTSYRATSPKLFEQITRNITCLK